MYLKPTKVMLFFEPILGIFGNKTEGFGTQDVNSVVHFLMLIDHETKSLCSFNTGCNKLDRYHLKEKSVKKSLEQLSAYTLWYFVG